MVWRSAVPWCQHACASWRQVVCPFCATASCARCKVLFHGALSCAEVSEMERDRKDGGAESSSLRLIQATSKPCPSCKIQISHVRTPVALPVASQVARLPHRVLTHVAPVPRPCLPPHRPGYRLHQLWLSFLLQASCCCRRMLQRPPYRVPWLSVTLSAQIFVQLRPLRPQLFEESGADSRAERAAMHVRPLLQQRRHSGAHQAVAGGPRHTLRLRLLPR